MAADIVEGLKRGTPREKQAATLIEKLRDMIGLAYDDGYRDGYEARRRRHG